MAQLRQNYGGFVQRDAEVVVVGPENAEAFAAYWAREELPFVGLPDPKQSVLKLYGQEVNLFKMGRMPAQVLTNHPFPFVHVRDVCQALLKALEKPDNIGQSYLVAAENLTFGAVNRIVAELSGRRLPIVTLPDAVAKAMAYGLTSASSLTRRPPWWGLSSDQVRLMRWGLEVDGSKATRELGIVYTPVREAIREALAALD